MPVSGEPIRDDQILVRYLLGSLPDDEAERLDELSVKDDDFVWKLRAAENELVDAYLRKELTGETLERFRSFYLASTHRREKVKFAEALQALSAKEPLPSRGWFAAPSMIPRWGLVSGIAAALLLAGVFVHQSAQLRNQVQRAQRERALSAAHREALVAMVLRPPIRGGGPIPEVMVPPGAERAAFELKLETDDFPVYVITLKDSGTRTLWRSEELKSAHGIISVIAPANLLQPGNYLFQLSPAGPNSEPLANYAFRVAVQ